MTIKGMIYYGSDYMAGNTQLQNIVKGYEQMGILTTKCHYTRNGSFAKFDNGDYWVVRRANDNARGYRWNVAYVERCIDYDTFCTVIRPAGTLQPFTAIHLFGEGNLHIAEEIPLPF